MSLPQGCVGMVTNLVIGIGKVIINKAASNVTSMEERHAHALEMAEKVHNLNPGFSQFADAMVQNTVPSETDQFINDNGSVILDTIKILLPPVIEGVAFLVEQSKKKA